MKGLLLLADYFEDTEALTTLDLLRRANLSVDTVSIKDDINLTTQSNVKMQADKALKDVSLKDYNFLIIPGGKAVMMTHLSSSTTEKIVKDFNDRNCLIACICAAPSILGKMGLLKNEAFTCFPGFEKYIEGKHKPKEKVVVSNHYITSKAMGTSFEFSYEIIKYLIDEKTAKTVLKDCYYI